MTQNEEVKVSVLRANRAFIISDFIVRRLPFRHWHIRYLYVLFSKSLTFKWFNIQYISNSKDHKDVYSNGIRIGDRVYIVISKTSKIQIRPKETP